MDFGTKLSGNTALAVARNGKMVVHQCPKGNDADAWLEQQLLELAPSEVLIDAPLSLPAVYQKGSESTDYFYRACDRQLQAMSPMFLGGLTARAMRLSQRIQAQGIRVLETYPGALVRHRFAACDGYRKDAGKAARLTSELVACLPFPLASEPANLHQLDALLAWWSGWRWKQGEAVLVGDAREGMILY
ncbi:MAG: DUF429 domain-containing protein [Bacteroidota bacterium]